MAIINKKLVDGIKVELDYSELQFCQMVGRNRSLVARGNNVRDAKKSNQDGAEIDVIGFTGEYAFAKHFNLFPDIGWSPRSGSKDGVYNGNRYDVKSTKNPNSQLLCTLKDNPNVDIYVLCVVQGSTIDIKGWALKSELVDKDNIVNHGYGECYGLDQRGLRQFKDEDK